jgi:hypothetical protein
MKESSRMIKCKIKFQNFTKKLKFKKKYNKLLVIFIKFSILNSFNLFFLIILFKI